MGRQALGQVGRQAALRATVLASPTFRKMSVLCRAGSARGGTVGIFPARARIRKLGRDAVPN